jgi:hypothetical protein
MGIRNGQGEVAADREFVLSGGEWRTKPERPEASHAR